jgi:predicted nucleic acid-binding protein
MASDYVLDASVILKWFLTTEGEASLAARVKVDIRSKKIKAYIPQYALIEVLNVLSLKPPYKGEASYTKAEIKKVLPKGRLRQKRLSDGDLMRALEIVAASGLVFYDALYIALAERLKAKYLTADYKASARLSGRGDVVELRAY